MKNLQDKIYTAIYEECGQDSDEVKAATQRVMSLIDTLVAEVRRDTIEEVKSLQIQITREPDKTVVSVIPVLALEEMLQSSLPDRDTEVVNTSDEIVELLKRSPQVDVDEQGQEDRECDCHCHHDYCSRDCWEDPGAAMPDCKHCQQQTENI